MSSIALLVLLCLTCSLHACNARLLAFTEKQIIGHKSYHFAKKFKKTKLSNDQISNPRSNDLKADHSIPSIESHKKLLEDRAKSKGRIRNENRGANALRLEILMLNLKKHDNAQPAVDKGSTSGNGITKLFSQIELQQSIEMSKGEEGHDRSMLGYAPQDTEEAVDTKVGDAVEDIVVMDYAQPHRKPPIHNEKP